jgi:hypothetical protein
MVKRRARVKAKDEAEFRRWIELYQRLQERRSRGDSPGTRAGARLLARTTEYREATNEPD